MFKTKKYYIGMAIDEPKKGEKYRFKILKDCDWTIWQTVPKVQKVTRISDDIFIVYWAAKVAFVKIMQRI